MLLKEADYFGKAKKIFDGVNISVLSRWHTETEEFYKQISRLNRCIFILREMYEIGLVGSVKNLPDPENTYFANFDEVKRTYDTLMDLYFYPDFDAELEKKKDHTVLLKYLLSLFYRNRTSSCVPTLSWSDSDFIDPL